MFFLTSYLAKNYFKRAVFGSATLLLSCGMLCSPIYYNLLKKMALQHRDCLHNLPGESDNKYICELLHAHTSGNTKITATTEHGLRQRWCFVLEFFKIMENSCVFQS